MLKCIYWLSSLLLTLSATVGLSASSSHHSSITKKSTTLTSSTHHTTTTKKTSTPTKTSTSAPTSTPSTFYLVAADTGSTAYDGSYFRIITDPFPVITISGDSAIQFARKDPTGAANFTLLPDGTLQANGAASGLLVACVSNGHPETQTFMFEDPRHLDEFGFVVVTCEVSKGVLSCRWGPLVVFYYTPSDVQGGKQVGEYVQLGLEGDIGGSLTIRVVPT